MNFRLMTAILALAATPLLADGEGGDASEGEENFRQCASCHAVTTPEGEVLAGRGTSGPNLYGIAGGPAGTAADFRYSDAMVAAGEAGLVFDEANFVAYLQDPTAFIREFLGDSSARVKMTFKVRKEEDAMDFYAYLASLVPAEEEASQ